MQSSRDSSDLPSTPSFQSTLIRFSDKISSEELEKMKFTLEYEVPKSDLQGVQQPFELFRLMRNKNLLSVENCDRLASIFRDIGRVDLSNELLQTGGSSEDGVSLNCRLNHSGVLPCKSPHFYGRSAQVQEIVGVLRENNGRRLVVITGLPGYGKSCLAQTVGHTMVENGFQVVFLCLREFKSVTKMASNILCYFHTIPGRKPCEQALTQLCSLTTKTILILDNAEDLLESSRSQEFIDFVNHVAQYAQNVKCVIASRISFPARFQVSRHAVELLELSNIEAAKLLQAKVQDNMAFLSDSDAKSIAELCLNIPLILHAAASLMEVMGPKQLIKMLEEHLAPLQVADMDDLSPELKMRRFIDDCFQQLTPDLQEALISLAVFPAAFTPEQAIQTLSSEGVSSPCDVRLIQLVKRSLVHSDRNCNQYFVHRVIQLFCEEKVREDPGDERLRKCYNKTRAQFIADCLSLVKRVQRSFLSKGASMEALCTYCAEERNLIQAILWAADDKNTAMRCARALNESVVFLAKAMKRIEFEEVYEVVLSACKDDWLLVADCLTCLGVKLIYSCECHRSCGVVSERSFRVLQRAKELYDRMGLTEGDLLAQCYSKISRCMAKNGDHQTALDLTEKALKIREKTRIEAPLKYAACCNDRAVVFSYLDNHQEALTLREDALAVYMDELDEHPFTATLYNYLGNDCLALQLLDRAIEYFSKALCIRKKFLGLQHQETARTLHDLGLAYKMKGNFHEALERLKAAVLVQDSVIDSPHEKLKSLQLMKEVCEKLNSPATDLQQVQSKILECEQEMERTTESNNLRLDKILEIVSEVGRR